VDDIIVTRKADGFHVCVNASNRQAVLDHLLPHAAVLAAKVDDVSRVSGQIAVQGPDSARLIQPLLKGRFPAFMHAVQGTFEGQPIQVSRTGYSGELGVELFVPVAVLESLWEHLLGQSEPVGLGARDTLRLEVGYPLYGHELSREVTPVEAGLSWLVDWDRTGYLGCDVLHQQRADRHRADVRRLVGLVVQQRGIPREGCPVVHEGNRVGTVTSGNMGLSVGQGVAMAYVPAGLAAEGTVLTIEVRGRSLAATVTRPPFYRHGSVRRVVD